MAKIKNTLLSLVAVIATPLFGDVLIVNNPAVKLSNGMGVKKLVFMGDKIDNYTRDGNQLCIENNFCAEEKNFIITKDMYVKCTVDAPSVNLRGNLTRKDSIVGEKTRGEEVIVQNNYLKYGWRVLADSRYLVAANLLNCDINNPFYLKDTPALVALSGDKKTLTKKSELEINIDLLKKSTESKQESKEKLSAVKYESSQKKETNKPEIRVENISLDAKKEASDIEIKENAVVDIAPENKSEFKEAANFEELPMINYHNSINAGLNLKFLENKVKAIEKSFQSKRNINKLKKYSK
jgi:hypothetical protein